MISKDPFAAFRQSSPLYTAVTAADNLTLTLTAIDDVAAFHPIVHDAIAIANKHGWRIQNLRRAHPGGNIAALTISPPLR